MGTLVKVFVGMMVITFVVSVPMRAWAQQEHGGKEHAGQPAATQEHGGKEHAGTPAADETATLEEAADALEAANPALAFDLRNWAIGQGTGDKNSVLAQAADALEGTDPDLASRVRSLIEG